MLNTYIYVCFYLFSYCFNIQMFENYVYKIYLVLRAIINVIF